MNDFEFLECHRVTFSLHEELSSSSHTKTPFTVEKTTVCPGNLDKIIKG